MPSCSWACALLAEVADVRFANGTVGTGCSLSGEAIQVRGEMVGLNLRRGFHVSSRRLDMEKVGGHMRLLEGEDR